MPSATSTWGIAPPVRSILRSRILELRTSLEEDADRQLAAVGLGEAGSGDVPGGRSLSAEEQRLRETAAAVIARSMEAGDDYPSARTAFVREAAFTFLDRAVAFRSLEERDQLLTDGQPETLFRRDAGGGASLLWRLRQAHADLTAHELARLGYRSAGAAMTERVKLLFDPDAEHAAFFPLQATWDRVVAVLNAPEIPAETYREDEVLGWVYQYWNSAEKDQVYAKLGKGGKIETAAELSAASCLYTERYIVDYLVQNTLGALWADMHPDSRLPASWSYYVRAPEGNPPVVREAKRVRDIRLLDPACGSGHFLVRAFELFRQLYAEEGLEEPADVPALILEHNLYGIDIDRRAIQIAALALYLKSCEVAGPDFRLRKLNLVPADLDLPATPPAAFLNRFADQPDLSELATSLWAGLAGVRTFGSLLHPEREINQTFDRLRQQQRGTLWAVDAGEWAKRRRQLLSGLRQAIDAEAESPNLGRHLFGTHAGRALDLVQILSVRYDVCVTNPPYAGSGNLDEEMKRLLERDHALGKRDLYAAFILRSREFARGGGYVGMVTQQSWMFLRTFAKLRADTLRETSLRLIALLGPHAFEEIGGEVVSTAAFVLVVKAPAVGHEVRGLRLIAPATAYAKQAALGHAVRALRYRVPQASLRKIPDTPLVFWLSPTFLNWLTTPPRRVRDIAEVRQGLATADDERFLRYHWEASRIASRSKPGRWWPFVKGGGYQKWFGLNRLVVDWEDEGARIRSVINPSTGRPRSNIWMLRQTQNLFLTEGLTYTVAASGSLGMRHVQGAVFGHKGNFLPVVGDLAYGMASLLSTRTVSYLLRVVSQGIDFSNAYVSDAPIPKTLSTELREIGRTCVAIKATIVASDPTEASFRDSYAPLSSIALLHALEGWNERLVFDAYELETDDVQAVLDETGFPAGWHPLIGGYDTFPEPPEEIEIPKGLVDFLGTLERRELSAAELAALKARLRTLYEAGAGAKVADETAAVAGDGEDGAGLGARIPIPTETFIEELSTKLEIHPISVYWLLEELKGEGVVSPPLRKAELTDYVSLSLLRMLGYRWPEQDAYEATHGPILDPDLVDADGIIPLVPCGGQPTAEARVRTRLERSFGVDGDEQFLTDFRRYVGRSLDDWLQRDFFKAHSSQFKSRPVAWLFRSSAGQFQALVLYHRLSPATLQTLRAQYAGDRIARLRADQQRARERNDTAAVSDLQLAIEDVEAFRERIAAIERGDTLTDRVHCRWKDKEATGRPGPYAPDIDDGVKVNIRPFQENGLLAAKVISKW